MYGDSGNYKRTLKLTDLFGTFENKGMTGVGQPAINAGYPVKRSSMAAFEKIVTAWSDRTDDAKEAGLGFNLKGGGAVHLLWWACTVPAELDRE